MLQENELLDNLKLASDLVNQLASVTSTEDGGLQIDSLAAELDDLYDGLKRDVYSQFIVQVGINSLLSVHPYLRIDAEQKDQSSIGILERICLWVHNLLNDKKLFSLNEKKQALHDVRHALFFHDKERIVVQESKPSLQVSENVV